MATNPTPAPATEWPSERYGWWVTFTLLVGFTFSFVDRQVLNLLVEPIQADLQISDTQISFLQGFAFVITYVAMSVPIGRLVDRFNRMRIMIAGILFWSAATVACGLSQTYNQLLAARLGVGAGGVSPSPVDDAVVVVVVEIEIGGDVGGLGRVAGCLLSHRARVRQVEMDRRSVVVLQEVLSRHLLDGR